MPNLINTDNAGNVFYNYITPVIQGTTSTIYVGNTYSTDFETLITTSGNTFNTYSAYNGDWLGNATWVNYRIRFAAPGLETRSDTRYRTNLAKLGGRYFPNNASGSAAEIVDYESVLTAQNMSFCCFNQYAFVIAAFNGSLTSLSSFQYIGYLREPSYNDAFSYPRGFVSIRWNSRSNGYKRVNIENVAVTTNLSTAADSITTPPINCSIATPGADATDITVRDAASPYNPVGKLWNCIQLPATCNVGELWRNVGVDADGGGSEQDVYLCVMPWGTAKLGMRVWTENVN